MWNSSPRLTPLAAGLALLSCALPVTAQSSSALNRYKNAKSRIDWFNVTLSGAIPNDPTKLNFQVLRAGQRALNSSSFLELGEPGSWRGRPGTPRKKLIAGEHVILALLATDGLLFGAIPYDWNSKLRPSIEIKLGPTARLNFHIEPKPTVSPPQTAPPISPLRYFKVVPTEKPMPLAWELRQDNKSWLPKGNYNLQGIALAHEFTAQKFSLKPGEVKELSLIPLLKSSLHSISGTVTNEADGPVCDMAFEIYLLDDPRMFQRIALQRERRSGFHERVHDGHFKMINGHEVGLFSIRPFPAGEIGVRNFGGTNSLDITAKNTTGHLDLNIIQFNGGKGPGLGFHLIGKTSPGWRHIRSTCVVQVRNSKRQITYDTPILNDHVFMRNVQADNALNWGLHSAGFRPVWGSKEDFLPESEGRNFATIQLSKGWGTRVEVFDQFGVPIHGAQIVVDGNPLGSTNEAGQFDLALNSSPIRIEANHGDWKPKLPFPPIVGEFSGNYVWFEIILNRP